MKLTKKQADERDEIVAKLRNDAETLAKAIETYNEALKEIVEPLTEAVSAYNEAVSAVTEFVAGIAEPFREKINDASERWQESDKGQNAETFTSQWESFSIEEFEFGAPDEVEEIDPSEKAVELEDLPSDSEDM